MGPRTLAPNLREPIREPEASSGSIFLLSPIFPYHKIKNGGITAFWASPRFGIPIPKSLAFWGSPSNITEAFWASPGTLPGCPNR